MKVCIVLTDESPTTLYVQLAMIPHAGEFVTARQFPEWLLVQRVLYTADVDSFDVVCTLFCHRTEYTGG